MKARKMIAEMMKGRADVRTLSVSTVKGEVLPRAVLRLQLHPSVLQHTNLGTTGTTLVWCSCGWTGRSIGGLLYSAWWVNDSVEEFL